MKVCAICREHGISDATFYNWKAKYGGLSVSELARIKELEAQNARLKRMYWVYTALLIEYSAPGEETIASPSQATVVPAGGAEPSVELGFYA